MFACNAAIGETANFLRAGGPDPAFRARWPRPGPSGIWRQRLSAYSSSNARVQSSCLGLRPPEKVL